MFQRCLGDVFCDVSVLSRWCVSDVSVMSPVCVSDVFIVSAMSQCCACGVSVMFL